MEEDLRTVIDQLYAPLAAYGLNVVGAFAILVFGLVAARWARRAVERALGRSGRADPTLTRFLGSLTRYAIVAFVVIAALQRFGVEATSLVAVFGAAGLAVGLALQGTLGNAAAGVMLLVFRPFRIGDFIEAGGQSGTVREVGLFTTELATGDNVQIIVPNGSIWGQAIRNYSANPTRRVDLLVGIGYGDDIDTALAAIRRAIEEEPRALDDPPPKVAVSELADSSVNVTVQVWANAADYLGVRWDLTRKFKERLEADGISIPFPQRVVRHIRETAE